jgi:hypothetical protein
LVPAFTFVFTFIGFPPPIEGQDSPQKTWHIIPTYLYITDSPTWCQAYNGGKKRNDSGGKTLVVADQQIGLK